MSFIGGLVYSNQATGYSVKQPFVCQMIEVVYMPRGCMKPLLHKAPSVRRLLVYSQNNKCDDLAYRYFPEKGVSSWRCSLARYGSNQFVCRRGRWGRSSRHYSRGGRYLGYVVGLGLIAVAADDDGIDPPIVPPITTSTTTTPATTATAASTTGT